MDIVFWLDTVPVCCKGIFDAVGEKWQGKAYYVCNGELDTNRKTIADTVNSSSKVETIYLKQLEDKDAFLSKFLSDHREDVHVFNGYKSATSVYLDKMIKQHPDAKIVVWAERPCPKWKTVFPGSLYHTYFARKYRNVVSILLPLGFKGVQQYIHYGWKNNRVFPFLYLPPMNEQLDTQNNVNKNRVRFVYLGRFSSKYKGTDVLIKTTKYLKNTNYSLEMVGGYGDLKDETMAWIEKEPNVTFGGSWPIQEACNRLSEYDICIVPSKYEGWNVTVNEALMAGIGCIVTDEAVSDEMVTASGAGIVVRAGDPKALARAMDYAMEHPDIVMEWKRKAFVYRQNMTADVCADYFIDVMQYVFVKNKANERPVAPWQI